MEQPILVDLLEKGKFKITIREENGDKIVTGIFDMMALESFLELRNIPGIFVLTDKLRLGMRPSEYADYVLTAIHRVYASKEHCDIKKEDVMKWFELMGGFNTDSFLKLIAHGMKLYSDVSKMIGNLTISDEEKKILLPLTASNGSASNASGLG